jgi:Flp pilus assembly protein TadG
MFTKATEKGQALIFITLAAIGLFGFAALAIDGSRVYSEKRNAQNAADTAAMAGALAYTRNNSLNDAGIETVAQTRATSNGYDNGQLNDVAVSATAVPSGECPGNTTGKDITVTIVAYVDTTFARVFGRDQVTTAVTATSRACGFYRAPLFGGHAIVGLNPSTSTCAFDSGQSNTAHWRIKGSGIFSNGCAHSKNSNSVTFDIGKCANAVGTATGFGCTPQTGVPPIAYPAGVDAIMPPNPCTGTVTSGRYAGGGIIPTSGQTTFNNGVYCISNFDLLDQEDIVLNNATLYVTDTKFSLKFAGGGGFSGTATSGGTYTGSDDFDNYYMVIARVDPPCEDFNHGDQVIEYRGNGNGTYSGTVLAPSACLDLRGNGEASGIHTQIIAYTVTSNGNAEVYINFQVDENHQEPIDPTIAVLE